LGVAVLLVLVGCAARVDAQDRADATVPFFDDGFVTPTAWTLPAPSLSVASVDLYGASLRFAPGDRLQVGLSIQVANDTVLERFEAARTSGTQYQGSARARAATGSTGASTTAPRSPTWSSSTARR
jgi:hypothetical protein